jgi:hypothetical protein
MTAGERAPLTALEWLRVTHADTLSGRRIEEAIAAERERVLAPIRALAEEFERKSDEEWAAYKHGDARDTRRANPYIEGASMAYMETANRLRAVLPPITP